MRLWDVVEKSEFWGEVMTERARETVNIRVDVDKLALIQKWRVSGFGFAKTEKNRSDVFNELVGLGIQTAMLRHEIGEKEFDQLWRILNRLDVKKLNLEAIEKMVSRND